MLVEANNMMNVETGDRSTRIRIALADDEPQLRRTMSLLLDQLGYEVVCSAENGAELLDACNNRTIDVALVDLDMPVMDGLATAQELSLKGIPVVLISGHPDAMHVVVEAEPVVTCILKPATVAVLEEAIRTALVNSPAISRRPK